MKVIHINDKLDVAGGVEVFIRDVQSELRARSIETHWVALRRNGTDLHVTSETPSLEWRGPVAELSRSPIAGAVDDDTLFHVHSLSEPTVLRELFELAPVVRHMHEPRMVCPGQGKFWAKSEAICTQPFGLHCFYHAYMQRCCNRHPKRLWHQYANTRYEVTEAAQRYAVMVANSNYTKREAVSVGYPADKIHVLNNFTDATPEPDWDAPQPPVIVFAGRLSRTKGVHLLLDAFAQVLREIPEARLEILGNGHDERMFFRQAAELGVDEAVRFLGWADKAAIDAHLSRAAVVAFPSIYPEAFGITGIEAMMRGKPVVAFDVGGVSDWLQHGVTGLFADKTDVGSLAAALLRLIEDDDFRRRLGRQARAVAVRDFEGKACLETLVDLYDKALRV